MIRRNESENQLAASYSRYSTDLQDNASLEQQKKRCREKAKDLGIPLPPNLEFADEGISGTDPYRDGLLQLLNQARIGKFKVLLLDSLSRFSRELAFTISTVKDLALNYGVRVISCTEGLDTSLPNWEMMFAFMACGNQQYIRNLRDAVRRGQEDAHRKGYSTGNYPFGYTSVDVPGSEYGRKKKLRKKVVIFEEHAAWVRTIFDMYVNQEMGILEITRALTSLKVNKDHRSTVDHWHQQAVVNILSNPRYVGIWGWGKKANFLNELTGKKRQELRTEAQFKDTLLSMEDLRIVDDATFQLALEKLEKNREKYSGSRKPDGKFSKPTNDMQAPRHPLQGLFLCNHCESKFVTRGAKYMQCSGHIAGKCPVGTVLPRELAEALLKDTFRAKVIENQTLSDCMYEAYLKAHAKVNSEMPMDLELARANHGKLEKKIQNLINLCADGEGEIPELRKKINELSLEKRSLVNKVSSLEANLKTQVPKPTKESMFSQIRLFGGENEKSSRLPAFHARKLFGEIRLLEVEEPGRKRKYFLGVGNIRTGRLAELIHGSAGHFEEDCDEEFMLEFIPTPAWMSQVAEIMRLHSEGVKDCEIAKRLGIPRCWIAPARQHDAVVSGKEFIDGRKLKSRLGRETLAKKYADQVKEMLDQGMLLQEIAKALGIDRNIVTGAKDYWYQSRELTPPDGRARRKTLQRKCSNPRKGSK